MKDEVDQLMELAEAYPCPAWDHPVWGDGSQDHYRCEMPEGHGGDHIGDKGRWTW